MSEENQNVSTWKTIQFNEFILIPFNPANLGHGNYDKSTKFVKGEKDGTTKDCLTKVQFFYNNGWHKIIGKCNALMRKTTKYKFEIILTRLKENNIVKSKILKGSCLPPVLQRFIKEYEIDEELCEINQNKTGLLVYEDILKLMLSEKGYMKKEDIKNEDRVFLIIGYCTCVAGSRTLCCSHLVSVLRVLYVRQISLTEGKKEEPCYFGKQKNPFVSKLVFKSFPRFKKYKATSLPTNEEKGKYFSNMIKKKAENFANHEISVLKNKLKENDTNMKILNQVLKEANVKQKIISENQLQKKFENEGEILKQKIQKKQQFVLTLPSLEDIQPPQIILPSLYRMQKKRKKKKKPVTNNSQETVENVETVNVSHYGVDPERVQTINNNIDPERVQTSINNGDVQQQQSVQTNIIPINSTERVQTNVSVNSTERVQTNVSVNLTTKRVKNININIPFQTSNFKTPKRGNQTVKKKKVRKKKVKNNFIVDNDKINEFDDDDDYCEMNESDDDEDTNKSFRKRGRTYSTIEKAPPQKKRKISKSKKKTKTKKKKKKKSKLGESRITELNQKISSGEIIRCCVPCCQVIFKCNDIIGSGKCNILRCIECQEFFHYGENKKCGEYENKYGYCKICYQLIDE